MRSRFLRPEELDPLVYTLGESDTRLSVPGRNSFRNPAVVLYACVILPPAIVCLLSRTLKRDICLFKQPGVGRDKIEKIDKDWTSSLQALEGH